LLRTEIARLACDALVQSIVTHGTGVEYRMSTTLVVRDSTAKALAARDRLPAEGEPAIAEQIVTAIE
jgi:hypothetical protein